LPIKESISLEYVLFSPKNGGGGSRSNERLTVQGECHAPNMTFEHMVKF